MTSGVIQISAPHFCAGVVWADGRVTRAAPILRYMVGWSGRQIDAYCRRKGWTWAVPK